MNWYIHLGTIHKRRRQFFRIFDTPLPHVGSFLVLSVGNFDQFLTPPPLPIANVVYGLPLSTDKIAKRYKSCTTISWKQRSIKIRMLLQNKVKPIEQCSIWEKNCCKCPSLDCNGIHSRTTRSMPQHSAQRHL